MSVIIRLQNLPLSAISIDIRNFFRGLGIPDGGVHIVGGKEGDAFIAFSTDEDARKAMQLSGEKLKDSKVRLSLSSRNEFVQVIEQARVAANPDQAQTVTPSILRGPNPSPSQYSPPTRSIVSQNAVNPSNMPNFGSLSGMGVLNGMNGTNFLGQHTTSIPPITAMNSGHGQQQQQQHSFLAPMMGTNSNSHMSSSMGLSDHQPHGTTDSTANVSPFGLPPPSLTGLTMTFPQLMSSTASGMSMNQAQAAAMMGMGMPPPNMVNMGNMGTSNSQGPNVFQSSRSMSSGGMHNINQTGNNQMTHLSSNQMNLPINNQMNLPGTGNNNLMTLPGTNMMNLPGSNQMNLPTTNNSMHHLIANNMNLSGNNQMHPNLLQQNSIRPTGFPGMNPAFMGGGGGAMGNIPRQNDSQGQSVLMNMRGRNPNSVIGQGMRPVASVRPDFNRDTSDRSRSPSEKRDRDRDGFRKDVERRRRSRSRDRDRNDRRRRSRSRSNSPKGRFAGHRRDSREKDGRQSSPGKIRAGGRRDSREADPPATPFNTTEEHHAAVKLIGVPNDASFREIKDFLRVDIMGGGDGTVRLYDECIAYVKLEQPSDFPRVFRSNGRRMRNSVISMEAISIERWVDEYKLNKSRMDRDVDRDKERERERERDRGDRTRQQRDRDDRSTERPERVPRPSRFNNAPQSSYIVIRNLPPTVTTKDVSSRLLNGVALVDIMVSAGPASNGRHTAIAHIKLDSPEAAQQAIDLIVRSHDGSHLVVEVSTNEDFNTAKMRTVGPGRLDSDPLKFGMGDNTTSIFDLEPGLDDESCSVILKGAPPNVTERDVFDFFSDIGLMPMNVKIMYDTDGGCNGQVVCEFPDPHKARRATTKDGMMFGRGLMQVELLPSGRRRVPDLSIHSKTFRPSLLGPRPPRGSRYGGPAGPNPFVQALQGGGHRPSNSRARGPNPRFGPPRHDFSGSNGVDRDERLGGSGRGRGRHSSVVNQISDDGSTVAAVGFGTPGCVLSLENVPFKASMDDILHHLSYHLSLEISRDKIIRRFDETEKPTGDARVAFSTPAEAKLAHDRLVGTKMWNRLISYNIV